MIRSWERPVQLHIHCLMTLNKCMYYDVTGENSARYLKMASSRRDVYENIKTLSFEEQSVPDKYIKTSRVYCSKRRDHNGSFQSQHFLHGCTRKFTSNSYFLESKFIDNSARVIRSWERPVQLHIHCLMSLNKCMYYDVTGETCTKT